MMELYQVRVLEEAASLKEKLQLLEAFINSQRFDDVQIDERARLRRQLAVMSDYLDILHARIAAFTACHRQQPNFPQGNQEP